MATPPQKSKAGMWIGIGVGCLVLLFAVVFGTCWWCKSKAEQFGEELGEGMGGLGGELTRISLGFQLSGIKMSCAGDPSGAAAANYFHPQVFAQNQAAACQVTDATLQAMGRSCNTGQVPCSAVTNITTTPDASRATSLGLDGNQCWVYTSGSAKIIGCQTPTGFKLIHLENPGAVQ